MQLSPKSLFRYTCNFQWNNNPFPQRWSPACLMMSCVFPVAITQFHPVGNHWCRKKILFGGIYRIWRNRAHFCHKVPIWRRNHFRFIEFGAAFPSLQLKHFFFFFLTFARSRQDRHQSMTGSPIQFRNTHKVAVIFCSINSCYVDKSRTRVQMVSTHASGESAKPNLCLYFLR